MNKFLILVAVGLLAAVALSANVRNCALLCASASSKAASKCDCGNSKALKPLASLAAVRTCTTSNCQSQTESGSHANKHHSDGEDLAPPPPRPSSHQSSGQSRHSIPKVSKGKPTDGEQ